MDVLDDLTPAGTARWLAETYRKHFALKAEIAEINRILDEQKAAMPDDEWQQQFIGTW